MTTYNLFIYNLSYDLNKDVREKKGENENNMYDNFLQFLFNQKIIVKKRGFTLEPDDCEQKNHVVLKPVESTIIFHSTLDYDAIAQKLNQYEGLCYVLNKIDRSETIGRACINIDLQNNTDKKIESFDNMENFVEKGRQHITKALKEVKLLEKRIELNNKQIDELLDKLN